MDEPTKTPAEPGQESRAIVPAASEADYQLDAYRPLLWTNVPTADPEYGRLVMQAHDKPTVETAAALNRPFQLRYIFAHPVTLHGNEDGELVEAVRVVLMSPDENTLAFVSGGMVKALRLLTLAFGPGPWEPPIPITIKSVKTRQGHTYSVSVEKGYSSGGRKKGGK